MFCLLFVNGRRKREENENEDRGGVSTFVF